MSECTIECSPASTTTVTTTTTTTANTALVPSAVDVLNSICFVDDQTKVSFSLPFFDSFTVPRRFLVGMSAQSIISHIKSLTMGDQETVPSSVESSFIISTSLDARIHSLECTARLMQDVAVLLQGTFAALISKCWLYLVWAWTLKNDDCAKQMTDDDCVQMLWSMIRITYDPLRKTEEDFKSRVNRNVKSDIKKGMRVCTMLLNDQLLFRRLAISGAIANNTLVTLPMAMLNPGYLHHLLSTSHGTLSRNTIVRQQFSWVAMCAPTGRPELQSEPPQAEQQQQQQEEGRRLIEPAPTTQPVVMASVPPDNVRAEKRKASELSDDNSNGNDGGDEVNQEYVKRERIPCPHPRVSLACAEADIVFSLGGRCEKVTSRYSRLLRMDPKVGRQLKGKDFSAPWYAFDQYKKQERTGMRRVSLSTGRLSPKFKQVQSTLDGLVEVMARRQDSALLTTITAKIGRQANDKPGSGGEDKDMIAVVYGVWWQSEGKLRQHVLSCELVKSIPAELGENDEVLLVDEAQQQAETGT